MFAEGPGVLSQRISQRCIPTLPPYSIVLPKTRDSSRTSTSVRRRAKDTAALRCVVAGRAPRWMYYPNASNGRTLRALFWSRWTEQSTARQVPSNATTSRPRSACEQRRLYRSYGATGRLRTSCTGCSMLPFVKTTVAFVPAMQRRTSPSCGTSHRRSGRRSRRSRCAAGPAGSRSCRRAQTCCFRWWCTARR